MPLPKPSPAIFLPQNVPQKYENAPPPVRCPRQFPRSSAPSGVEQGHPVKAVPDLRTHHEALITFLFPCVTFGQIAEILGSGSNSCFCSAMAYFVFVLVWVSIHNIMQLSIIDEIQVVLPDTPCPDFIVHCLCEPCALCQEYRELQHRGLDPSLGWSGNLARAKALAQREQAILWCPQPTKG
ncbi:hypothetical protein FEM48_ZijujUnG0005500 [Ziziphus jujuba var. spinosa]|uniref:PLAC8 motif-containing protein n=1 Tax=Ziziphus jujuba var. spinosa TaxID=714518 RepID=A0A978UA19_ZIZJJ|nr:hypothetical protein FEM48_ZijujUnG0005500 [Ziziphus jujuba var. spinosa]